jgi:hypothetical protein
MEGGTKVEPHSRRSNSAPPLTASINKKENDVKLDPINFKTLFKVLLFRNGTQNTEESGILSILKEDTKKLEDSVKKDEESLSSSGETESSSVFQVGGHGSITKVKPGWICKRTIPAECDFYRQVQVSLVPESIKEFFPKVSEFSNDKSITIEDITEGYIKPCVMDIKMGIRSYGEDATPMKQSYMISQDKSTTTYRYGLRLVGLRTYHHTTGQYISTSKASANSIYFKNQLERKLFDFFYNGEEIRKDMINYFLGRLETLLTWMESQKFWRFYSSSLLFVYEGDVNSSIKRADIRMIDFAHVFPICDGGTDDGYVKGLKTLICFFKKYISDYEPGFN